jgi:hypothetical protein
MRTDPLIQDNLYKFTAAAGYLISHSIKQLAMEMVRVLANAVADVDTNRQVVVKNRKFLETIGTQLQENFDDGDLNERICILLKNLVIDSPQIAKQLSIITDSVIVNVGYEESSMGLSVLAELISYHNYTYSMNLVDQILKKLENGIKFQSEYDEDEYSELMVDMTAIVEQITHDPRLDFSDEYYEQKFQLHLMDLLRSLESMEFSNKLTVQRRLYAASGNISANPATLNRVMIDQCIKTIQSTETNGYVISIAFCILGNYITAATQRSEILDTDPKIITHILSKYTYLVDPIQFQGILHILKNLISFDSIFELFTDGNSDSLSSLIEATVRNSRYYTNFGQLLVAFLKKALVLLGKSQLDKLLETSILESLLSADSTYDYDIIFLLLLNKMSIHGISMDVAEPLLERVFKFPNPRISDLFIFEMTKTIAVLLQHNAEYMLLKHTGDLTSFVDMCPDPQSIPQGELVPQLALMVENNLKYICTSLVTLNKGGKEVQKELLERAEKKALK